MVKVRDENDRLCAGTLPEDPFADLVPVDRPAAQPPKPGRTWRTYGEILAATQEKPREYLVPGLVPFGALVLVIGHAKRAGKSTFAWALLSAAERGAAFLGHTLPRCRAVVLAEDGDYDLADRIRRFGLSPDSGAVLSRSTHAGRPDLEVLVREAVLRAQVTGARVLLVDTFAFWAALDAAAENDAGAVTQALRPLQEAADAGLAVLLIHHPSKNENREGGNAARGSSAFAGTVEATIEIRTEGTEHPNRRRLHCETRFAGTFDLAVELREGEPATFDLLGDAAKIADEATDGAVLDHLREAGGWQTTADIETAVPRRGGEVRKAVARLARSGRVLRIGKGRAGNPFLHAIPGTPLPPGEAPSEVTVPGCSPAVPGNGGTPPEMSVPAVPGGSMNPGTETDIEGGAGTVATEEGSLFPGNRPWGPEREDGDTSGRRPGGGRR